MRDQLLRQLDLVMDYNTRGESQYGWVMGLGNTGGLAIADPAGGHLLERRDVHGGTGHYYAVGFAESDAITVVNTDGFPHDADQAYHCRVRWAFGNGHIDGDPPEPIRVDFSGGVKMDPKPNGPVDLAVEAIAGGKYRISFRYEPYGQGVEPSLFKVFEGDPISYATPLTDSETGLSQVNYDAGNLRYSFTTAAYTDGTAHKFAVRSYSASDGLAELNTDTSDAVTAISSGPAQPGEVRDVGQFQGGGGSSL